MALTLRAVFAIGLACALIGPHVDAYNNVGYYLDVAKALAGERGRHVFDEKLKSFENTVGEDSALARALEAIRRKEINAEMIRNMVNKGHHFRDIGGDLYEKAYSSLPELVEQSMDKFRIRNENGSIYVPRKSVNFFTQHTQHGMRALCEAIVKCMRIAGCDEEMIGRIRETFHHQTDIAVQTLNEYGHRKLTYDPRLLRHMHHGAESMSAVIEELMRETEEARSNLHRNLFELYGRRRHHRGHHGHYRHHGHHGLDEMPDLTPDFKSVSSHGAVALINMCKVIASVLDRMRQDGAFDHLGEYMAKAISFILRHYKH